MRSLHFQRLLGSGAFGSVYLADLVGEQGFRRQVAVKVLLRDHAQGDMFMSRVRDEARLLGLLADDHILKVLELARIEGRDAVLMEYVEGVDLGAVVQAGSRPPPRALGELGAAVAGALHRAHRAVHPNTGQALNVIHRDVKPANVMLTSRGGVKLLDFGVARARFEARESYTGQFVLGTLNYMAPEYIVTGEVSPAADIYGLALTLWEAACGDVFGQPKLREDLHLARVEERLAVIADTHAELVPILRQMLGWDPRARPDGAAAERAFLAAADMLRGTGLRTWAAEAVPGALAREREAARDEVGLLGRVIPIGDAERLAVESSKVGARPDLPNEPSAEAQRGAAARPSAPVDAGPPPRAPVDVTANNAHRAPFLQDATAWTTPPRADAVRPPPAPPRAEPAARATPPSPPPSRATSPAPEVPNRRPPQRPKRRPVSGSVLLLQGLLLGGALGGVLLALIAAILIARSLL
jgi:tRNA A-37 threonylcarbamoyl transferase component Bud32